MPKILARFRNSVPNLQKSKKHSAKSGSNFNDCIGEDAHKYELIGFSTKQGMPRKAHQRTTAQVKSRIRLLSRTLA